MVAQRRVARKAPTNGGQRPVRTKNVTSLKIATLSMMAIVGVVGASVFIGRSDSGEINVAAAINQKLTEREAKQAASGGGDSSDFQPVSIPVANAKPNVPNGGLKPSKVQVQPAVKKPVVVQATSTATSTVTSTASSSESTTEKSEDVIDEVRSDETTAEEESTEGVTE
jgi:type II secretory pathway pseudopilin PulG